MARDEAHLLKYFICRAFALVDADSTNIASLRDAGVNRRVVLRPGLGDMMRYGLEDARIAEMVIGP
jgi:hypothetical protein